MLLLMILVMVMMMMMMVMHGYCRGGCAYMNTCVYNLRRYLSYIYIYT